MSYDTPPSPTAFLSTSAFPLGLLCPHGSGWTIKVPSTGSSTVKNSPDSWRLFLSKEPLYAPEALHGRSLIHSKPQLSGVNTPSPSLIATKEIPVQVCLLHVYAHYKAPPHSKLRGINFSRRLALTRFCSKALLPRTPLPPRLFEKNLQSYVVLAW